MMKFSFLLFIVFFVSHHASAQKADSLKAQFNFSGSVTVTSKGISTVPNLTLGKPAAIFDLNMGRGRLSFEPNLRFALEGRPWSFLFWWKYKLVQSEKFRFNLGVHPALSFRKQQFILTDGVKESMVVYRYLAGEAAPTIYLSKNTGIGLYWLYSRGIEKELTRNTNLISLRATISNIPISENYFLRLIPQVYYLNMDHVDGFYLNAVAGIYRKNFPWSVTSLINNPIKTNIAAGNEFLWNVSLVYSFAMR